MDKIKVLIVEDSALMRKMLSQMLSSDKEIEVIGIARDGEDAVLKARELKPDVITMDINMPKLDGLTALQYIVHENICPVVMVSSLSQQGAVITFEALELGAFDYVPKPGGTISLNIEEIKNELIQKVKLASKSNLTTKLKRHRSSILREKRQVTSYTSSSKPLTKAVVIGVSTGGPKTLNEIIPDLPEDIDAAVFIVQHIPENFTESFAKRLDGNAKFPIKEVAAGDTIQNGHGYVGKGGYHLLVREINGELRARLSNQPHHLFIPSVGIMMESVLQIFGNRTVGVLLTGMGDDGADAMVKIKNAGGVTIAESEETAIVYGMPKEAVERGGVDYEVPSYKVAEYILRALKKIDKLN
jgi:two-component system chemotaxis response regulator CheB